MAGRDGATVRHTGLLHTRGDPGGWVALCSAAHAEAWRRFHAAAGNRAVVWTESEATESCAHCAWCGRLAARPPVCDLHMLACPPVALMATEAVVAVVRALAREDRLPWPCDDAAFELIVEVAEMLHGADLLNPRELYLRVRDALE